ncbi:LamG domain-containing protein [Sulfurospirillum sp. 1307]
MWQFDLTKKYTFIIYFFIFFVTLQVELFAIETPIANYQMDECHWNGTTKEVKDISTDGTDNSGTITGSIQITKDGKIYNGGEFSGGAIDIDNLNVSTATNAKTTVAFWMYWDGTNNVMPFGWGLYDLWLQGGKFGFNTFNSDIYGISNNASLKNGWHHITAVFNNGDYTQNKLYIDGVNQTLSQQNSSENISHAIVSSTARIGGTRGNNGYRFKGKIDELKIWNGELGASTIQSIYNNEVNNNNYDGTTRENTCIDPVADYRMDSCFWDGHSGDVIDSSYNNLNGTSQNGASTESNVTAGGGICHVGKFDNKNYVKIPDNSLLQVTNNYTFMAWVKTTKESGTILSKTDPSSPWHGYVFAIGPNSGGKLALWNGSGGWKISDGTVVNDGSWHQVGITVDGTTLKFYVDGVQDGATQTLSNITNTSTQNLQIGFEQNPSASARYFSGDIDEVKIFDKTLSDSQIQSIYNNEQSKHNWDGADRTCYTCETPIANYQMDECHWNGTTKEVKDISTDGTDNSGTITGSIQITKDGKIYNGGEFSGGAIDIDNLNVSTATNAKTTVAFWMYWDGTNNVMPFGWGLYDLWLQGGKFGFNTFNSDIYGISNNASLKNGWHHITAVFNNGDYTQNKLYIDGVNQTLSQQNSSENISHAIVSSTARIGGTRGNNGYRFKGKIDELKIWNGELGANSIRNLYYDIGNGRSAPMCGGVFDAWDTFRDINDRNISTKIVNKDFNLTIASLDINSSKYQEFNGTVCVKVDNNITKLLFIDQNTSNASFNINKAIKDTRVSIAWKRNVDENCPLNSEDNSTKSTDNFAIRPLRFNIDINTTSFYAGVPFHVDLNATSFSGTNSFDYNETNSTSFVFEKNDSNATCISGTLSNLPNPFKFSDGNISFDTSYSDVGYVKLYLKEINGSEFAKVDADDTNNSDRLIQDYNTTITVKPYQFSIVNYSFTRNPNQDWRYMSDVKDSNISVFFQVQAQNKDGNVTHKFDKNCYAQPLNVVIDLNATSSDGNVSYYKYINNASIYAHDKSLNNFNLSDTINEQNFTDGNSTKIIYALNVYRKFNDEKSPLEINVIDVNTSYQVDTNVINAGLLPDNNRSKFYYGRVKTKDISTNKKDVNHSLHVEVYDTNKDSYVNGFHQVSLNWYVMKDDNNQTINETDFNASKTFSNSNDANLNISNTNYSNGILNFKISNPSEVSNAYIHVDVPTYLWYSKYNDYNISDDCAHHPCFRYDYIGKSETHNIHSGDFNGTTIGREYNATKTKKGVKVFR